MKDSAIHRIIRELEMGGWEGTARLITALGAGEVAKLLNSLVIPCVKGAYFHLPI